MSTSSKPSNVDLADKKAELEQYYIQLLEKRIAALEALTSSSTEAVPDEPSSSTTDPPNNRLRRAPTVVDGTEATTSLEQNEDNKNEEDQKASEEAIRKAERKKRVRAVVSTYDRLKGVRTDSPMSDSLTADKSKNLAFTFRRILPISERGVGRSEVDIESQDLRRLLSQVIGEYTGQSWEGKIVSISSPFAPLIHFWDELQAASKPKVSDDESSRQAREDLEILLEYVGTTSELEKYFKTRESNLKEELTTYEELWTLFIPGKTIFAKPFLGMPQLFVVHSPPFIWDNTKPAPSAINLYCWCYDWNGRTPVKVWYFIKFDHFRGTKPINELVAYPSKFYKSETSSDEIKTEEELISHLVTRGLKFDHTVRGPKGATQQHQYDGEALADRRTVFNKVSGEDDTINPDPERRRQREDNFRPVKVKCPYIVDHEAFLTYGSGVHTLAELVPKAVTDVGGGGIEDRSKDTPAGRKYLSLLPPRYLGYSTQEKFWGQFRVNCTSEMPEHTKSMFNEQLQLDEKYKHMIHALVQSHESKNNSKVDKPQVNDVMKGKGNGLVILLHGPPGVGKTLTAETIAEASRKPLFVVSVAEIGLDASKAEKNLEQMFALAGTWEAVLLVDEADVFLETRTKDGDVNRNALVSVLLRVLEYYQGIMILTTNRITSLDVAVQSRIHLAIRYDDLSKDYKKEIFKMFLDQLEPGCIKGRDDIDEWVGEYGVEAKLNGRQIRNVVSSALAMARSRTGSDLDERLNVKDLKAVSKITKEFQEQLESITTASRARNEVKAT